MSSSNPVIRGKSLYAVVDGPTWEEAETNSVALGGHLVTINDAEENEWISSNFTYNHSDIPPLWIGYTDKLQEGTWSWSSGESTSYTNWERLIGKEPNGGSNQNHGVIYLDRRTSYPYLLGSWNDAPNENYGQLGIAEIPFIRRGDSAYVIVEGPTWDEAEANALALGGHLVTINDAEEDEWIKNNIEWKVPKDPNYGAYKYDQAIAYWIGLNDHEKEGVTVWSSGELSTYRRNLSSDSFGTEDWFTIVNLSGGWNDLTQTPGDWSMGNWQMEYGIAEIPLAPNKTPTGTLTLTGDYKVGNTISIDTSTIEDADNFEGWTPTYEYSWELSDNNGNSWTALTTPDATDGDNSFTLTSAEVGKQLRGIARYVDGYGTNEVVATDTLFLSSTNSQDQDGDGFVDEVTNYQIWTATGGVNLTNRRGKIFSDATSRMWNAEKAVQTNSGFSILIKHERRAEKYKMWSANSGGIITTMSKWKSGDQMMSEGHEDLFALDLNGDFIIGKPPIQDLDDDGFVDAVSKYQVYTTDDRELYLRNKNGKKIFSDATSRQWDAVKVITTDYFLNTLIEGTARKDGKFKIWTSDLNSGNLISQSKWKTEQSMTNQGYESVFNYDINDNDLIGS